MQLRPIKAILAVAGAIAGLLLVTSPNASAAAPSSCPSGQLCFYQDGAYKNGIFITNVSYIADFNNYKFNNGRSLNDGISSIYNNTGHTVDMFVNAGYVAHTGECQVGADSPCYADEVVPAHTGHSKIVYNDKYSSFYWDN